jgi:(2Fe-2S) ferredoxin
MPEDPPPFFSHHVFVCTNKGGCADEGSKKLAKHMKSRAKAMGLKRLRVNPTGCMGRCKFGPVFVLYPEGVWYSPQDRDDVEEILTTHVRDGGRVERLMLPGRKR